MLGLPGTRRGWARCIPATTAAPCLHRVVERPMHRVWVSENPARRLMRPLYEGVGRG
jgi:hypothetical protein